MKIWIHFETLEAWAGDSLPVFAHGFINVPGWVGRLFLRSVVYAMRKTGRIQNGWPIETIRAMTDDGSR